MRFTFSPSISLPIPTKAFANRQRGFYKIFIFPYYLLKCLWVRSGFFDLYAKYINNYHSAIETLNRSKAEDSALAKLHRRRTHVPVALFYFYFYFYSFCIHASSFLPAHLSTNQTTELIQRRMGLRSARPRRSVGIWTSPPS